MSVSLYEQHVTELQGCIEELYDCFRKYPLRPKTNSGAISEAHLHVVGIRHLPVAAFKDYLPRAMNSWGNVKDFKHFVPRLLELLATTWPCDAFFMFTRLQAADWRHWPDVERAAVEKFFMVVWKIRLAQPFGNNNTTIGEFGYKTATWMSLPAECFFDFLSYAYDEFSDFLCYWDQELRNAADPFPLRIHLAWLVLRTVFDGKIPETFPFAIQHASSPRFTGQLQDWLFTEAHAKLLEDAYYRWPNTPESESFSQASDLILRM
jgi:hypothetical protein